MPKSQGDHAFTAESLKSTQPENSYSGALSFFRRRYTKDLTGVDVAVTGIPLDIATSGRPGARFGPAGIRAASCQIAWGFAHPSGLNPFEVLAVADTGDCHWDYTRPVDIPAVIEAHAREILASGASLLSLGGDHFVAYPLLKAHAELHGPLALVHFDAHCDTTKTEPGALSHGTMFYHAVREGLIDAERSIQIGIRTHYAETHGLTVLEAPWVHERGTAAVVDEIRRVVGDAKAYLSFDIDCLDPAFAPGTGTPVPGGLSTAQALAILRGLGGIDFVGMDLAEVAPAYDHAEITSLAAASLAVEYLILRAARKTAAQETKG